MDWETEFYTAVWAGQIAYHPDKQYIDSDRIAIDSANIAIDGAEQ